MIVALITHEILSIVVKNIVYMFLKNHRGVIFLMLKFTYKVSGKLCKKVGLIQSDY